MRKTRWIARKFWLNAGLSLSVAGMPWTATIGLLGASTIATLTPTPAQAAMLSGWEFDPSTQELRVTVPGGTTPRYFLAAEPARIVLDLPNTEIGTVPLQQTYDGAVREIRVAQFEPGVTRLVLELAPGTVLAPGHVELQQVETGEGASRWLLRPLLAANASVAMSAPTAPAAPDAAPAVELPPLEPGATEIPVQPPPDAAAMPPSRAAAASVSTGAADSTMADLPAAESTAVNAPQVTVPALPTNEPTEDPAAIETNTEPNESAPPESVRMPFVSQTHTETLRTVIEDNPESSPQDTPQDISEDTDQNPADPNNRTEANSSLPAAVASSPALPESNSFPTPSSTGAVSVPSLPAPTGADTPASPPPLTPTRPQSADQTAPPASTPTPAAAIEFGQPLPKSASSTGTYPSSSILLPSGTTLNVRYTGEEPLELVAGEPRQEVLVLAESVSDESGNVVLPEGSPVVGRFETNEEGSQFIAQAISLQGQSLILHAQSEPLSGRNLSQSRLLRNSGLGAAAGVLLGLTGIGLIPALAAGAATAAGVTFLPGDRSHAVQPDQVLEVHLTQDLTPVN